MSQIVKPTDTFKIVKGGKAHIPVQILRELEIKAHEKIAFVCDAKTVILFNPETPPEIILKSLDVLRDDVELRIKER